VVVGDEEPFRLPILVGVDELYDKYYSAVSLLIWMPAPPTTLGSLALGCGFKRKNFRNKTQWGFIPTKA
jgi:hypothetical protein